MTIIFACVALGFAVFFANKYFRQKVAIRLLAESLTSRTSILTHSSEFREVNENWGLLLEELNRLIEDNNSLSRKSSGQLNQIETTLGSLQEGVMIIDRDNYILLVNNALKKIFPSMSNSVGQRIESGMGNSDFLDFVWDVKKGRGPAKREIAFRSGQSEVWLDVTAARLSEALEGNAPWFLFVLHDTTRQKLLAQARKNFVANASHELKTPVAVIKGYSETLVSDHETMPLADRAQFISTIYRHSERLALLINDLLSLSRLESDSPSFDWSESDVLSWIREIAVDYGSNPRKSGLKVETAFPAEMWAKVRYDVLKLRQVFDNLVENACKYSPEGGSVRIGARVRGAELLLWVEDEGAGVPKEDLNKIFERFYRVDKGRSRETGGTGLGLSIVKHIIEWHDGQVWAEIAEKGGLRVVFSLPLLASSEGAASPRQFHVETEGS
ncbi:ATP-binding protein [Pelagicoccus sp. SDUM812005]|uniref:sensor histidine kinase n=1 Tax=Pelagicoccus sp. SDUM812005 TaxID=3041257 RepID=UPI00280DCA60|nr:ATP-binding protein [Pelagicoccus sp. SDUM812005]MDQ8181310.1 ATP-binding protein [Pelagicoccus sp. SDUM812005]